MATTPDEFKAAIDKLVATLTSDEMVNRMRAFKHLPPEDRLAESAKLLSVDGLKEMGIEMPDGMRLSSRYFESDRGTFEFGDVDGDKTALDQLADADPGFIANLKAKHPDVYNNLKVMPANPATGAPTDLSLAASGGPVQMGACGGAGGSVGGTGGCACGGSTEELR